MVFCGDVSCVHGFALLKVRMGFYGAGGGVWWWW